MSWKIGRSLYIVHTHLNTVLPHSYFVFCRFVVLIDEMKIREDLVYDKTGTSLHGFVNLGDVNNQLRQIEIQADTKKFHECLATQMLTVMVRGIFIKLEFPYASFSMQGLYI